MCSEYSELRNFACANQVLSGVDLCGDGNLKVVALAKLGTALLLVDSRAIHAQHHGVNAILKFKVPVMSPNPELGVGIHVARAKIP